MALLRPTLVRSDAGGSAGVAMGSRTSQQASQDPGAHVSADNSADLQYKCDALQAILQAARSLPQVSAPIHHAAPSPESLAANWQTIHHQLQQALAEAQEAVDQLFLAADSSDDLLATQYFKQPLHARPALAQEELIAVRLQGVVNYIQTESMTFSGPIPSLGIHETHTL